MVSTRKRTDKPTNSSTSATAQQASKTTVVAPSGTHKGKIGSAGDFLPITAADDTTTAALTSDGSSSNTSAAPSNNAVAAHADALKAAVAVAGRSTRSSGEPIFPHIDDIEKILPKPSKKRKQLSARELDGSLVKVKMLTGTLYLHRGPRRSAEFVRHK